MTLKTLCTLGVLAGVLTGSAATGAKPTDPMNGAPYCVIDLVSNTVTTLTKEPNGGFNTSEYKTSKLVLKRVAAGAFTMGDADEEANTPHKVTLTRPFYMGLFEVTQAQWAYVMGETPAQDYGVGDQYPVYYVSYSDVRGANAGAQWPVTNGVDAASFIGQLRAKTGLDFDLPTEAQWEYACRAGSTTAYSCGAAADRHYMWYLGDTVGCIYCPDNSLTNAFDCAQVVGTKMPNAWGFYDMHGNVWEWCLDWYSLCAESGTDPMGMDKGAYRICRGGCWSFDARFCTSAYRGSGDPSCAYNNIGFRLALTVKGTADAGVFAAAQTYNGWIVEENGSLGSVYIKTGKAKVDWNAGISQAAVTARIMLADGTKFALRGTLDVATGELVASDGKEHSLNLTLTDGEASGTFEGRALTVTRDVFSSKTSEDKKTAAAIRETWSAPLALAWQDDTTGGGWNTLSLTVGARGKVKVSGALATGVKVSSSAQLLSGTETDYVPVSISQKGVKTSFNLLLGRDGALAVTGQVATATIGLADALAQKKASFALDAEGLAALLGGATAVDALPNGVAITTTEKAWSVASDAKASGLKLSYKAKTGTFSGSFKASADVNGKTKTVTVSVNGVVLDGVGYGAATVRNVGSVWVTVK